MPLQVTRAATLADAHTFITGMDDGYKTMVIEGGTSLSGGQKQRIAIARALLENPKILLFDEATSALDRTAANEVLQAIRGLSKGRTTITIAHQVNVVAHADVIHVIKDGCIVESGQHETMKVAGGAYQALFDYTK